MSDREIRTERGVWSYLGTSEATLPAESTDLFDRLMDKAREARERAYAPYSKFSVGAAARMDGAIYTGANVENASYGATICAERSAIASGASAGAREISLIAITTSAAERSPVENRSPCGMCRQVISEFAAEGAVVLLDSGAQIDGKHTGEIIPFSELMPLRFRLDS